MNRLRLQNYKKMRAIQNKINFFYLSRRCNSGKGIVVGSWPLAYLSPKRSPHSGHRAGISSVSYSQEIAGKARNEVVGVIMGEAKPCNEEGSKGFC